MDDIVGADAQISREILGLGFGPAVDFAEMLVDQGELRGLIGPREVPILWRRHILNSAAVGQFLPREGRVADVGSGAGLPGIVLAIMKPELEFHLIEPMERRIEWLAEVVDALDLDNVVLHHRRAEELHKVATFDAVTARAVAALEKLLRFTMPLVAPGGELLALKGAKAQAEVEDAKYVLKKFKAVSVEVHTVDVVGDGEATQVVQVRKGRS